VASPNPAGEVNFQAPSGPFSRATSFAPCLTEIARVTQTVDAIGVGDWPALGELFAASHASMRDDFEISCPELDLAVEAAVGAGAVGARMTGGGFGGSAVAVVPAAAVPTVTRDVGRAFDSRGFRPPTFLLADPSSAAGLTQRDR